jgi:hypothetical protein
VQFSELRGSIGILTKPMHFFQLCHFSFSGSFAAFAGLPPHCPSPIFGRFTGATPLFSPFPTSKGRRIHSVPRLAVPPHRPPRPAGDVPFQIQVCILPSAANGVYFLHSFPVGRHPHPLPTLDASGMEWISERGSMFPSSHLRLSAGSDRDWMVLLVRYVSACGIPSLM